MQERCVEQAALLKKRRKLLDCLQVKAVRVKAKMIPGVEMIAEGCTLTTLRFSKNTGDTDYSLSVTILIPSLFDCCKTRVDIETAVMNFGETHKTVLMDLYFEEMLEVDSRYECMKAFNGLGGEYECFVDNVSPLMQLPGPLNTDYTVMTISVTPSRPVL